MHSATQSSTKVVRLGAVFFPGFELLDAFGPLEMFAMLAERIEIVSLAERAGPVASAQRLEAVAQYAFAEAPALDLLLVPGGFGTRAEVANPAMLDFLRERSARAQLTLSVCTGAALLAAAGLLDGRRATTNKMRFEWVAQCGPKVDWVREARWVEDGPFVSSSGPAAGIDMALAVIARLFGEETSDRCALVAEYERHRDSTWDPFARIHGLVA